MDAEDPFLTFLNNGFDTIEGWPGRKESVRFLQVFRDLFESSAQNGGACEIGVHHAKYLIALHNLLGGNKASLGLDLFEKREKNIDGSGRGSRDICLANIAKFAKNPHLVRLVSHDSISLKIREVKALCVGYSPFFSLV